jgi:hypothetical protein
MNDQKLRRLFQTARRDSAPTPGPGFESRLLRAIARERPEEPISFLDQLGAMFPRAAVAAVLLIGLCFAGDFCASQVTQPDWTTGISVLSAQWLFTENGF